jgi:two-component system NarL family sensor kinase
VILTDINRLTDGNQLLYRALLLLVLCAYSIPVYMGITLLIPATSNAMTWVLNILAVIVLAATLRPVSNWVQPRVHTLVYAMDDSQLEMMGQVSDSLVSASPEASMLPAIAETIARTVKLPYVQLETSDGATAAYGVPPNGSELTSIAITYRNGVVGWLHVTSRLPQMPLTSSEGALLNSLARQVGITLHAAELSEALQASREQLVLTREEERRRIRRDLHDGLGPTLASLRMQLSAVRRLLREHPDVAEQIIDELQDDVGAATADIRHLVYELRPPMLDELGLINAISNFKLGDSSLRLHVIAPQPMPRLSAAVEVAVYRIASEAIHNVIKHADATTCVVEVEVEPEQLILTVSDDGHYIPGDQPGGIGLSSMQERAAELGGVFAIQPAEAGGAHITVHLPLGSTSQWTS